MTFHIPNAGVLHGLAGYFEAVLYRNVGLSIHPEGMDQISPGMLSWFPLFFPFRVKSGSLRERPLADNHEQDPLYLPSNSELQVSIWRVTGKSRIWYEWYAESYLPVLSAPPPFRPTTTSPAKPGAYAHAKTMSTPASNFLSPTTPGIPSPMVSPAPSPTSTVNDWDARSGGAGGIKMGSGGEANSGDTISGTVIKIGQTALHNPEGRGSWTGL
jgi:type II protein arginine methyltransferase